MSKREDLLEQARSLLGAGAGSWVHTALVDDYNSIRPLPQGYRLQYSDAWCAAFVSVCAKRAGLLELIPAECSCPRMIEGFRALGRWVEDDGYVPAAGDIIFYDWEDSGSGDNTGTADHVGIIESVDEANGSFTTIEGNISSTVARRFLPLNGQYIRGFGVPGYGEEGVSPTMGETPSPHQSAAQTASPQGEAEGDVYTVKSGDSWWRIAEEQLGSGRLWEQLMKLNGYSSPEDPIYAGQVIRLRKDADAERKAYLEAEVEKLGGRIVWE